MKTQTEAQSAQPGAHPLAGKTMSGADMILQVLADEGVDTIFGYSGGSILPTYDAIFRYNRAKEENGGEPVRLIVPANEQGATFMAAGYARSTGRVGVALVTSGPGATNTVTPVRDCAADSIPLVLICGQVPRAVIGTDAFQEAPVSTLMSSCAKHVFLVTKPEELEATVRSAFFIARTGRPGPVVIDVPKDVQNWSGAYRGEGMLEMRGYRYYLSKIDSSRLTPEEAQGFFRMLAASERPLLYVGGGAILGGVTEDLRQFQERFQIPAVNTLTGIGATDPANPLTLHMIGMHGAAYANYAVEDCDFLIAVGSRFDDRVAGKVAAFAPGAKFIAQIDIDATEIGKIKQVQWCHVGDAGQALRDLLHAGRRFKKTSALAPSLGRAARRIRDELRQGKRTDPAVRGDRVPARAGGPDAIVTTGVGQHQMWAAQYYRVAQPRHFLTSGSMGTMGFGLPAAIGAQAANPAARSSISTATARSA